MIIATNVTKKFGKVVAVDDISATITEGQVFGLIGTNGAGKSTFLRMVSGIIKPNTGEITINGANVYENEQVKSEFFYISDEQFFFLNAKPIDMKKYYENIFQNFDGNKFNTLMERFELPTDRKIRTFSKGMKKQLSVILGISANTNYIICDETFDGLDPVMRQGIKSIFASEIEERGLTPIIASHNLREIEDICENIGLLHRGGMILSNNLDSLKLGIYKIQCIFKNEINDNFFDELDIISKNSKKSLFTLTIRGKIEEIEEKIQKLNPVFYEILPLTLEEIFITETEAKGYDIKNIIG